MNQSPISRPLTNIIRAICNLNRLNYPRFIIQTKLPEVPANYGTFRDIYGVKFAAYPPGNDHVTKALFWFGAFDPWVVRTMKRLSGTGSVVCDVGANLGDTALPLAEHVGPSGKVFCFEPLPDNVQCLRANIDANRFNQVVLCPLALTEVKCELDIEIIEGQPGMSQVANEQTVGQVVKVAGIPFDDWAAENKVENVAVCKIDVQGHELNVLAGMSRMIAEKRMQSFVFEHEGAVTPDEEIFQFFFKQGYNIYRIENRWFTNVYTRFGDSPRARRTRDFVAVLANSDAERMLS